VAGWEESDESVAEIVAATDREVDARSSALEERILELHRNWSTFAADLRLLHVGLIAVIALERVGDLAVSIAKLAGEVPPEGAVPSVQALIRRMSARAVDALAQAVQAIARGDAERGEEAVGAAQGVRLMLDDVLVAAAEAPDSPETRTWATAAVLVGRHLERVANNAAELGGRVRFLVSGELFVRSLPAEEPGAA